MDIANDIHEILANGERTVSREWLDEVCAKYPYFSLPTLLYLHRNHDNQGLDEELLAKLAISSPDRKALYAILGEEAEKFTSFYPTEPESKQLDTDSTLDTFLATYGNSDEKEIEMLNRMIFNPVPDYAQMLAAEEERNTPTADTPADGDDALINNFIRKNREHQSFFPTGDCPPQDSEEPETEKVPIETPTVTDDSMLSESLAKIYIKQRKYSKALEIIKSISLKFPEKSIYFADQIRFLRKLIKTEDLKK